MAGASRIAEARMNGARRLARPQVAGVAGEPREPGRVQRCAPARRRRGAEGALLVVGGGGAPAATRGSVEAQVGMGLQRVGREGKRTCPIGPNSFGPGRPRLCYISRCVLAQNYLDNTDNAAGSILG